MHWPKVELAVELLRQQGLPDVALEVEMCRLRAIEHEVSAANWRRRYEEMQQRYEPRTNVRPYTRVEE